MISPQQTLSFALFKAGIKPLSDKIGHNWVQVEFSRVLIGQQKKFPHLKGVLNEIQKIRDVADYSCDEIEKKKAKRVLDKAQQFVESVAKEVGNET